MTVFVSPNATPYAVLPINATNLQSTEVDEIYHRDATQVSAAQDTTTRPATGSDILSPPTDRLPGEMSTPMPSAADRRVGMPPVEDALQGAKEAMTTIDLSKTWEGALERVKWVMDTLSPVAGVRRNVLFTNH